MKMNLAWLLLIPLAAGFGCDDDDDGIDTDLPGDDDDDDDDDVGEAQLRLIHLAPEAGAVDARVGDQISVDDVMFTEATEYFAVDEGAQDVQLFLGGTQDAALDVEVQLDADQQYTVVAWESLPELESLVLTDDTTDLPAGQTRLQLAHVAIDVGEIDILDLSGATPTLLIDDLARGQVQTLDIPSAATQIGIDIDDDLQSDLDFDIPALGADQITNVFAVTDAQGNPFLLALGEDGTTTRLDPNPAIGNAQLRLLHLAEGAGAVDIWVDDCPMPTVWDLSYLEGTSYIPVIPGMHTYTVVPSGGTLDQAVLEFDLNLQANQAFSAVLFEQMGALQVIDLLDDDENIASGDFRLQVSHLAEGLADVDIYRLSPGPMQLIADDFEFQSTLSFDLEAGIAYDIGLDIDNDGSVDWTFALPAAQAGELVDLYAVRSGTQPFLVGQLPDGTAVEIQPQD